MKDFLQSKILLKDLNQKMTTIEAIYFSKQFLFQDKSSRNTFLSEQIFNSHVLITVGSNRDQQHHFIHKYCKFYGRKPFFIYLRNTMLCVIYKLPCKIKKALVTFCQEILLLKWNIKGRGINI